MLILRRTTAPLSIPTLEHLASDDLLPPSQTFRVVRGTRPDRTTKPGAFEAHVNKTWGADDNF